MTVPVTSRPPEAPAPPRSHRTRRFLLLVAAVVTVVVAVLALLIVRDLSRDVPSFPRLADNPDPLLHGTVAYLDDRGCVTIVAAAGAPSKQVMCLPLGQDVKTAEVLGKEIGPQLVWRPHGRLEVTMFRMTKPSGSSGPTYSPGWQKVVNVRTGNVREVPAAKVPTEPAVQSQPATNPDGERVHWTSDDQSGRISVMLDDAEGTRTLLSAHGPGGYTYGLTAAFWAPDWQWIVADDGRILVITPDEPAQTRVLVDDVGDMGFSGPGMARFAVTAGDYLAR